MHSFQYFGELNWEYTGNIKEAPKINCSIISLKFLVALTKNSERTCVCESGEKYEKYISKVIPFHFAYMTVCMKYCYSLFTKRTFNIIFVYPEGLTKKTVKNRQGGRGYEKQQKR